MSVTEKGIKIMKRYWLFQSNKYEASGGLGQLPTTKVVSLSSLGH